jgi:hypothetical protein
MIFEFLFFNYSVIFYKVINIKNLKI